MTEPLTPESLAELRRLAEAANADAVPGATYQRDWPLSSRAVGQFLRALNPDLALGLLDAAGRLAEVEAERDALAAKVELVREWIDRRAVDVSERDGDYMDGYRAAQRHALHDAAELRRALDGTEGDR